MLGEKVPLLKQNIKFDLYNPNKIFPCLNIICCILFASDHTCQMPLHILISDIVDKFTNSSSECLKSLNKLGICCSKDSLKRYQTDIVEK